MGAIGPFDRIVAGGVSLTASAAGVTLSAGQLLVPDGTSSLPAIAPSSATGTGFLKTTGVSGLGFAAAGVTTIGFSSAVLQLGSGIPFGWGSNASANAAGSDVLLYRDAAATLAQRNGANAQIKRVYNTFTDASNGEWAEFGWSGNLFSIVPKANGTGTVRSLKIGAQNARSLAQAGAVASLLAVTTPAADGTYLIMANVLVTAYTAGTFTMTVAYTDESNTARTLTLTFSAVGGTLGVNIAGAGAFEGVPLVIRAKASTTITFATTGTFTTLTYNAEADILQIN